MLLGDLHRKSGTGALYKGICLKKLKNKGFLVRKALIFDFSGTKWYNIE